MAIFVHWDPATAGVDSATLPEQVPLTGVNSSRSANNLVDPPLYIRHTLRSIHRVQPAQPLVVRNQRRGLLLVSVQPRRHNFFAIVRPLLEFAAVGVAASLHLWRSVENIINLAANLARSPAGDSPQHQRRADAPLNHQRRFVAMLRQQDTQILRLRHRARKAIEHETMPTVRLLDAFRD